MKTRQELSAKLLQASQEVQKNLVTLLEHSKLLEHHLSVGKKKEEFKYEVVGDGGASSHELNLTELQDDFLEVHASTQVEEVCNGVDKTSTSNISLEFSYDADNTNTCDGHLESTYDDYDDYDEICVDLSLAHYSSSIA